MKQYLKMAGAFDLPVKTRHVHDENGYGFKLMLLHSVEAEYDAHAINSHDELVENMQHYKQEAEQWEARAVKEASMVQEFDLEVERLRAMVSRMQTYLDMAGEYPEKESDNPVRQWLFDAIDCTK